MSDDSLEIRWEQIPAQLRDFSRWLVWHWVERDGKLTKPPCSPDGRDIDATDATLWMTFETVKSIFTNGPECRERLAGIGFAVQDTGYVGIDLDKCIVDGEIAQWAQTIVDDFKSYTEITPSGEGLRIWIKARKPGKLCRKGHIEIYDAGRYFTVTGNQLPGTSCEIRECQSELDELYHQVFKDADTPLLAGDRPSSVAYSEGDDKVSLPTLEDNEILRRAYASKAGVKIAALFAGDITGYPSQSEADLALLSYLAFWFAGDQAAMDRVFRQSALCDDKWVNRADYRASTIARALKGSGAYDPRRTSGQKQAKPGANGNGTPREPGDDEPERPDGIDHRTDLGNARRLVALHGPDMHYVHPWKKWLVWAGDRWVEDDLGTVTGWTRDVIRQLFADSALAPKGIREEIYKWAIKSESNTCISAMVSQARFEPDIAIKPDQLDANPWYFNCANGTLDLRTGTLLPHSQDDLITKCCNVVYDPRAQCPTWDAFLDRIMAKNQALIGFLRRAAGLTAIGVVFEHVLLFLYGSGRNGKSTFIETMQHVFGDYAINVNAEILMDQRYQGHSTGITDLFGKRWVGTVEVSDGRTLAEALVKSLTGGDKIRARRVYENNFEFTPSHTLWMAANDQPKIKGIDEAIWSRIKQVPFDVFIPEDERDLELKSKLKAEASGILNWVVRGCLEWRASGLKEPTEVKVATKEYRETSDDLKPFLDECCELDESYTCAGNLLYEEYQHWAVRSGIRNPMDVNKFGRGMTKRGYESFVSNSVRKRRGIRVKEGNGSLFSSSTPVVGNSKALQFLAACLRRKAYSKDKLIKDAEHFNITAQALNLAARQLEVVTTVSGGIEIWDLPDEEPSDERDPKEPGF